MKNIKDEIYELKKEKNAIILAHNYQPPEIQDIADLCGDSLELSIKAAGTDAHVIVFCGVHFMAETASILSPDKKVLLPEKNAGCPMADMVTPGALKEKLKKLPPVPVITYVNSPASVKALTTVCCTSANVIQITNSLDNDEILMVPDRNLARYAMTGTDKKIHLWDGFCPIHDRLLPEDVKKVRKDHPQAVFIAHPECRPEVLSLADKIASTSGMLKFVNESKEKEFIIGTEIGLIYPLKKANPDKIFYPASAEMECPDMKKISLNDIAKSLKFMDGEVKVPEEIRKPALKAVQRMIGMKKF